MILHLLKNICVPGITFCKASMVLLISTESSAYIIQLIVFSKRYIWMAVHVYSKSVIYDLKDNPVKYPQ